MSVRFCVVIPMFNVADCIGNSITRLREQRFTNFRCQLIDDLSTDSTVAVARKAIANDDRFELVINREKKYALRNAVEAIDALCSDEHAIVVPIDGDDSLAGADVLSRVAAVYEKDNCLLTYGSYTNEFGERGAECAPYPEAVVSSRQFRHRRWHATHLKTFTYGLWQQIPSDAFRATDEEIAVSLRGALLHGRMRTWWHWRRFGSDDLLDPSGTCFRRCYDKAMMYPMLEMAAPRISFIPDELYRYRSCRNVGAERSSNAKWGTRLIQDILRRKPVCG